jgi:hypothetical protein
MLLYLELFDIEEYYLNSRPAQLIPARRAVARWSVSGEPDTVDLDDRASPIRFRRATEEGRQRSSPAREQTDRKNHAAWP